MNNIVIDASSIIAVILGEPERKRLIELTAGCNLFAPSSLACEIGNAFSAMFKKKRLGLRTVLTAIDAYEQIPIQFKDIDLKLSLEIAHKTDIYAYDAYMIACAVVHKARLLTLDKDLCGAAKRYNVDVLEVKI